MSLPRSLFGCKVLLGVGRDVGGAIWIEVEYKQAPVCDINFGSGGFRELLKPVVGAYQQVRFDRIYSDINARRFALDRNVNSIV